MKAYDSLDLNPRRSTFKHLHVFSECLFAAHFKGAVNCVGWDQTSVYSKKHKNRVRNANLYRFLPAVLERHTKILEVVFLTQTRIKNDCAFKKCVYSKMRQIQSVYSMCWFQCGSISKFDCVSWFTLNSFHY